MKQLFLISAMSLFLSACTHQSPVNISSFEDCVAAGNPVMESYPRQCAAGGQTFVEDIGNELEMADVVQITNPRPNQTVSSPLTITGQARGTYFFEANFPVRLETETGEELVQHYAQAEGEWMTEDFVPFSATLEFSLPPGVSRGNLILEKANPSGLPEHDATLQIPVTF
jgi:hypothetical protein